MPRENSGAIRNAIIMFYLANRLLKNEVNCKLTENNVTHLKRKKLYRFFALFIALLVGFVCFHLYAAHFIVEIKNPIIEWFRTPNIDIDISNGIKANGKSITYSSDDGLNLNAFLAYAQTDTAKASIILLHGIRASKDVFIPVMNQLTKNGYHAIAVDLRAHGGSEGQYCTFGFYEKLDVSNLVDYLLNEEGLKTIGVWGQSLGGAVALQSLAKDKRLKFGIIESAFSDFPQTVHDYTRQFVGFDIAFLTDDVIQRAGRLAQFNPFEITPSKFCQHIEQPVFMSHGDQDQRIHINCGKENFHNLKSQYKIFEAVKNAGHGNLWKVGGHEYMTKVLGFLDGLSFD